MTKPADRPRLTMEDYVLFFTTRSGRGLTVDQLNQILFMHGFKKFHNSNKPVIVDALNSLEPLRPRRSTVSTNAVAPPPGAAGPSAAVLSTEAVKRDIQDLGWGECPVGSVLSIHAGSAASSPVPLATIHPGSAASSPVPLAAVVQGASPPSTLGASSSLPSAAPGVEGNRKRVLRGQGKAATKKKERRMRELLKLPSIEVQDMPAAAQSSGSIASAV
ncbi:hypothetical protein D1007_12471 [Hordeum vulgare]|nr:hypothetical protein D1007_12471 [Hordeum vulgare]